MSVSCQLLPMSRRKNPQHEATCQRLQKAFGIRLQVARRNLEQGRANQETLADALGITRTSISNIERGQHRVFLDQVYLAARALGIDARDLLPSMDDVFPPASVHSAPDAGIDDGVAQRLMEIATDVQRRLTRQRRTERPQASSSSATRKA